MENKSGSSQDSQESDIDSDSDTGSVCSTSAGHLLQVAESSFKVFVRKLPLSITKEEMESHLRDNGLSGNVTIFYDKSKNPKGCGCIEFSPSHVGINAISVLNSTFLNGMHKIEASEFKERASPRKENSASLSPTSPDGELCSVYVAAQEGKLPSSIEDSHLEAHFWEFESCLERAYVMRDRNTMQTKGYAFVVFKSKKVAESVVESLNRSTLHGCQLKLSLATRKHKDAALSPSKCPAAQTLLPHTVSMPQPITPPLPPCFPPPENSYILYLSNLSCELDQESIVELCDGGVTDFIVAVHADSNTKMVKITFFSYDASKRALDKFSGKILLGRTVCASRVPPPTLPQQQPFKPESPRVVENVSVKVTHMAATVSEESLREIFSQAGRIVSLIVFSTANRYARINYSCESEADKAVSMFQGVTIEGSRINVSKKEPSSKANSAVNCSNKSVVGDSLVSVQPNPTESYMYPVKVTRLAASVDESSICHIFKEAGEIVECKVFPSTNRYALVNYKSEPEADNAVRMFDKKEIEGMNVNVSKRPPQSRGTQAQAKSSPPQSVTVQVSKLNPSMQIQEHWKCLTDIFSAYKSAKVEDVCPPVAYIKFDQAAEAYFVVKVLNGSYVGGTMVEVKVIHGKPCDPTDTQELLSLSSAQCNLLTAVNPDGSSLYQELTEPFKTKVKIDLLLAEMAVRFSGQRGAVESAHSHFKSQLKRHVPIELECVQTMVEIYPDLPAQMIQNYGVLLEGFREQATVLKLSGPQSGVDEGRRKIDNLIASFQKPVEFPFAKYQASLRKRMKGEGISVRISPSPTSPKKIIVCSFSSEIQGRAIKIINSNPNLRVVPFNVSCSPNEIPLHEIAVEFDVCIKVNEAEKKIYIKGFVRQDVLSAQVKVSSIISKFSVQEIEFKGSREQSSYLQCKLKFHKEATEKVFEALPAKVIVDRNRLIKFGGSKSDIASSQKQLIEGPLLCGLQFQSFTFTAQEKFFFQLENHVLKPMKREHPGFEYVRSGPEGEPDHRKGRRGSTRNEASEFTVTVFSQEPEVFDKAVVALKDVTPSFKRVNARKSLERIQEKKDLYEQKYRVNLIVQKDSNRVLIFGLTEGEVDLCSNELREEIESTTVIRKSILVDPNQMEYFQKKKAKELKEIRGICKVSWRNEASSDTVLIRIEGTVKKVTEVIQRLDDMRSSHYVVKVFTMTVEKRYNRMWWKHWEGIVKEKEEMYDIAIKISKNSNVGEEESKSLEYEVTICGGDEDGIREVEQELSNPQTAPSKIIRFPENIIKDLDKAKREREVQVIAQYNVNMYIDLKGKRVILTVPSECGDQLEAAAAEIEQYAGKCTLMERDIIVDDPVVGLVLSARSKGITPGRPSTYLTLAYQLLKPHRVSVQVLRYPKCGLRLRGSQESLDKVEPLIRQSVIENIQSTIDDLRIYVSATLVPYFDTPECATINGKIKNELSVLATYPKSEEYLGSHAIVVLRGPKANLTVAQSKLEIALEGALDSKDITLPSSLESKVMDIMKQNHLECTIIAIAAGGTKEAMKRVTFKGLSSSVSKATSAIQEETINYHVAAAEQLAVELPPEWEPQIQNLQLWRVAQGSPEWNRVVGNFQSTLLSTRVIEVTRIQNKWLWERYVQHKQRLSFKNNGSVNEKELFHGTRHNDPKVIYDGEDGFDMQFSCEGMWGRANYFAVNASYSNSYAHTRSDGTREMFMVKVLTGESCQCPSDRGIRMPPEKQGSGGFHCGRVRYDTVTGTTGGSQVFMAYDNDKAYPAYLIQYQ